MVLKSLLSSKMNFISSLRILKPPRTGVSAGRKVPFFVIKATKLSGVAFTDDGGLSETAARVAVKEQMIRERTPRRTQYLDRRDLRSMVKKAKLKPGGLQDSRAFAMAASESQGASAS